jgi:uncharacterized RDD family membrane protein YckC
VDSKLNENLGDPVGATVELVSFRRRFVAYLIDDLIVSVIQLAILIPASSSVIAAAAKAGEDTLTKFNPFLNFLILLSLLLPVGYFVGCWAVMGQTPGKIAMGIKVISVDGSPVSWGKAILRYIGYLISSPLALGFIWVAYDAKRQGWHDKIAGTYVVRKDVHFSLSSVTTFIPSDVQQSSQGTLWGIRLVILLFLILFVLPIFAIAVLLLVRNFGF